MRFRSNAAAERVARLSLTTRPQRPGRTARTRRTRPGAARARPRRRTRRRARGGRSPTAPRGVSPIRLDRARVLLGQRDVGDRRVVGRERDRDAGAGGAGRAGAPRPTATIPAWTFEVGQRSSVTPRAMSSRHSAGSSIAPGPWAIRSGSTASARRTCGGAAPLAGVERDPQAAGPGGLERRARGSSGSGNAASGPARSQPVRPSSRNRAAVSASVDVVGRVVRAERRADEPDDRSPVRAAAARAPRHDRRDPVGERQPARDVEQRPPADLDVADAVGGLRLDQLGGDPLERLGVLHQRDRQVERAEQLGLVAAALRRDERAEHPGPRRRRVDAARRGQLQRRRRPGASRRGGGGARPWASPR